MNFSVYFYLYFALFSVMLGMYLGMPGILRKFPEQNGSWKICWLKLLRRSFFSIILLIHPFIYFSSLSELFKFYYYIELIVLRTHGDIFYILNGVYLGYTLISCIEKNKEMEQSIGFEK